MLIIAVFAKSELYLVDSETGDATLIDLGGEAISGDGLVSPVGLGARETLPAVQSIVGSC